MSAANVIGVHAFEKVATEATCTGTEVEVVRGKGDVIG